MGKRGLTMGTRHLIQVIDNEGEMKVAQYGQFDGYPSGMGVRTLFYATYHLKEIERGLKRVRWASEEEVEVIYAKYPQANYLGTEDCENLELLYPNLVRETSADVLMTIAYSVGEVLLVDNREFANDELYCEGIYTINYQTNMFTSMYNGTTWELKLDELPEHTEYLELYKKAVEMAEENKKDEDD